MNYFWKVFQFYKRPFRGLFYMPLRWLIVPFSVMESYLPREGLIIDVGCGEGIMAVCAALSSSKRKVLGFDINQKKITLGKLIAQKISNLSFEVKNILNGNLPKAKGFVLSDVLHHLPKEKHKFLLEKMNNSLTSGGILVIKEVDLKDKIRSKISRFLDFLFYPRDKINFIDSDKLKKFLVNLGFKVRVLKLKKWFPGSTTLFICQK